MNFLPPVLPIEVAHPKLAIIPVQGLLLHRIEGYGTCYEAIRMQLQQALDSAEVEHIILDIDSGGGEVNGLFDLVDDLFEARKQKPITALINEVAYSAAYLIASSATQIIASQTASVGSIGVIVAHIDQSEANKKMGLKFTEIFAGSHKADCSPNQPLSESVKDDLQLQVDETYELLIQALARNRNMSSQLFRETQARIYSSQNAISLQLIDKIQPPHKFIEELIMSNEKVEAAIEMPDSTQVLKAERERVKSIMNLCQLASHTEVAMELIEAGASVDNARKILFDKMVAHSSPPIINALGETQSEHNQLVQSIINGMGGR